ncbi:M48 family metalloprotease [Candidatus Micrarchaeota archaeon]|nr:M48 family metalloprotease [Candidatus Micrarchaeota archaeon]
MANVENLMLEHVLAGLNAFAADPLKLGAFAASAVLALILYALILRESDIRAKTRLVYLNLLALAFPLALLAFSLGCSVAQVGCAVTISQSLLLAFPAALVLALAFFRILGPRLQTLNCTALDSGHPLCKFVAEESLRLGIPHPRILLLSCQKPVAYSISSGSPAIVISIGAMEVLTQDERKAVVLHELYHVARRSPSFKISAAIHRLLIPFSGISFFTDLSAEEKKADGYAAQVQGTPRFVNCAKEKFS